MRKKEARSIIRDWLDVLEWPSIPMNDEPFKQDRLVHIIAQERNLPEVDRTIIKDTIKEMTRKKTERS